MRNYFKGNTAARRKRMKKIHSEFLKHQSAWAMKRFVKYFGRKHMLSAGLIKRK